MVRKRNDISESFGYLVATVSQFRLASTRNDGRHGGTNRRASRGEEREVIGRWAWWEDRHGQEAAQTPKTIVRSSRAVSARWSIIRQPLRRRRTLLSDPIVMRNYASAGFTADLDSGISSSIAFLKHKPHAKKPRESISPEFSNCSLPSEWPSAVASTTSKGQRARGLRSCRTDRILKCFAGWRDGVVTLDPVSQDWLTVLQASGESRPEDGEALTVDFRAFSGVSGRIKRPSGWLRASPPSPVQELQFVIGNPNKASI